MTKKKTTQSAEYWKEQALKEMRAKVELQIRQILGGRVQKQKSSKSASDRAKQPRKKNKLKAAVLAVMAQEKPAHSSFKTFMQGWELGHLNGLTITYLNENNYLVSDENGDAGDRQYEWSTLKKMYSEIK